MNESERIDAFLAGTPFAVAGASTNRAKYGNKVLRCYLQNDKKVYAVHPRESEIEGVACYPDLASLPEKVHGLSVITPPQVTEQIVEKAAEAGITHVWMQPGAESAEAIRKAGELGLNVIAGGACLLVALGFRE
ncbi:MAG: CoA-binding protein [Planctomycetota bacterium]|jgi:predicted CoA-binding protein